MAVDNGKYYFSAKLSTFVIPFHFSFSLPPLVLITVDCTFYVGGYVTNITNSQCTVTLTQAIGSPCTVKYMAVGYLADIAPLPASSTMSSSLFLPAVQYPNVLLDYGSFVATGTSGTISFHFTFPSNPLVFLAVDCNSGTGITSVNTYPYQFSYFLNQSLGSTPTPSCSVRYLAIGTASSPTLQPSTNLSSSSSWYPMTVPNPNTILDYGIFYATSSTGTVSFNALFSSPPYVFVQSASTIVSSFNITTSNFTYNLMSGTTTGLIVYVAIGSIL
jgi:hypothetical protein